MNRREKVWFVPIPGVPFRGVLTRKFQLGPLKIYKLIYRENGKCYSDWHIGKPKYLFFDRYDLEVSRG